MTEAAKRKQMAQTVAILEGIYPEAVCALEHGGEPWRLMVMARLSAQCTDARVNEVCRELFARFPTLDSLADAPLEDIADIVSNLRSIEGVQIAVTMKETDKNRFSISVRSNTNADVASLCAKIGGGGHPRAAGATVEGTPEDAKRVIIDLFSGAVV